MAFNLGLMALRRLCEGQDVLEYHHAKLSPQLFKGQETQVFEWVDNHVKQFHALPQLSTLISAWPEVKEVQTIEPSKYYLTLLENQFFYEVINRANIGSQELLKADKDNHAPAMAVLQNAIDQIVLQKYRTRILDVPKEAPGLVMQAYHHTLGIEDTAEFGWPYMDSGGALLPGDVVSFIGRPAQGKTFQMLFSAIHNWVSGRNVMFVSMEMSPLPIAQRIAAMYAHTNITQLKTGGYATGTYKKFADSLKTMMNEKAAFYVVDGNLAASADDVYILASQLKCKIVYIDGAYLMRHKNTKLDRFTRAAENVELMKRHSTDLGDTTFASWQFSRDAVKNKKKGEVAGLEDIGYTDAIGQISSIVLGLFQEDGVETMIQRVIRVLKGRNGEIGQFSVLWDFVAMNFNQVVEETKDSPAKPLNYV